MNQYQPSPVTAILRHADASTTVWEPYQVLVPINTLSGKVVTSWVSRLVLPLRYYLVTNGQHPNGTVTCWFQVDVQDIITQRALTIIVHCQLRCDPGCEARVAEALHGDADPYFQLHTHVRRWVQEYTYGRENEVVHAFFTHRDQIIGHVHQRAREVGLTMAAQLSIRGEEDVPRVLCVQRRMPVYLADRTEAFDLNVRVDLEIDSRNPSTAYAVNHHRAALERRVLETVNQFMPLVRLREFRGGLESGIRTRLTQQLNEVAVPYGRKVVGLLLDGALIPSMSPAALQIIRELTAEPWPFWVKISPRGGGLAMTFKGEFIIRGVFEEHQRQFVERQPPADVVKRDIEEDIRMTLSNMTEPELLGADAERLMKEMQTSVVPRIRAALGLEISVVGLQREYFGFEARQHELRQKGLEGEIDLRREVLAHGQELAKKAIVGALDGYSKEIQDLRKLRMNLKQKLDDAMLMDMLGEREGLERRLQAVDKQIADVEQKVAAHRTFAPSQGELAAVPAPRLASGVFNEILDERSNRALAGPPAEDAMALPPHKGN